MLFCRKHATKRPRHGFRPRLEALETRLAPAISTWDGGSHFSSRWSDAANWVGKFKSFIQFTTVCVILGVVSWHRGKPFFEWMRFSCIWITVVVTALSIVAYLQRARSIVLSDEALGAHSLQPRPAARPATTRAPSGHAPTGASA